jgi:site-specific DNA-methyltransferase (cytosine-N4-specific)
MDSNTAHHALFLHHPISIVQGDCRKVLSTVPDSCIQTCITSPPYFGLRDYRIQNQIGLEEQPSVYIRHVVDVFRQVRRVLKPDGVLWLVLGDSYARQGGTDRKVSSTAKVGNTRRTIEYRGDRSTRPPSGFHPKELLGIPWRIAFELQSDGWRLRQDIVWHKTNAAPESVRDRCTRCHEYVFMFTKSRSYYFDCRSIEEQAKGGAKRNRRSVWSVPVGGGNGNSHPAAFPADLIRPCILAGSRPGDTILDPFAGSGSVGRVALETGRKALLIEVNSDYVEFMRQKFAVGNSAVPNARLQG